MQAMSQAVNYHPGAATDTAPTATKWRADPESGRPHAEADRVDYTKMLESPAGLCTAISRGEENLWLSSPRSRPMHQATCLLGPEAFKVGCRWR